LAELSSIHHFVSFFPNLGEKPQNMLKQYKILLVEDNAVNIQLIKTLLFNSQPSLFAEGLSFPLISVHSLAEAINFLQQEKIDVILLNLMLPDSQGIESLIRLKEKAQDIPIIIQTASEDETTVVRAFQMGANGYIHPKNLDANLLLYAIRLAIERQQYIEKLSELQKQQRQAEEFTGLENLANAIQPTITAKMFGAESLKKSLPEVFQELTQQYADLLDLSLEQRILKVDHNISGQLRSLADKLGFFKASPRDVVDIHTKALKDKTENVKLAKLQAYVDEGRLKLLELMGYLTSYYRKYYIGLSNLNVISSTELDNI
jgi:CheY-like chemotaxis protein